MAVDQEYEAELRARRLEALKHIRQFGDPVLKSRARPVDSFDSRLAEEVEQMGRLMHDAMGVGLAAPQVGIPHRLLVYRTDPDGPIAALVNPVIEWSSDERETMEEGCLSMPDIHVDVERPVFVRLHGLDETGAPLYIEASGFEARVIQHEIDHLDGILILDRTSRDQRKQAIRALRELERERAGV